VRDCSHEYISTYIKLILIGDDNVHYFVPNFFHSRMLIGGDPVVCNGDDWASRDVKYSQHKKRYLNWKNKLNNQYVDSPGTLNILSRNLFPR